ncbi:roundabout-like protein [Penaeus vannamei]|uniref:Roundabout-like protein n=1 Tax=Penaeus vannamei TaxID=6689 RepID=A0A3R7MTM2_PENVA|nr:roundabout-like protein [Penaeus vannamei]
MTSFLLPDLREDFRKSPSSVDVPEGKTAVFECEPPKGHPIPVVTWRLDGEDLTLPRHRYRQEGSTLLVSHVVPADEGEYQCVVTNMANQRVSPAAILTVFESARVGGVVKSMVGVAGHDVTLPCAPTGNPDPQVLWSRVDGPMPVGRARVGRDWSLTISDVTIGDQGVYVCEASNVAGSDSANTSLAVVEPPRVDGGVRPRIAVITPTHVRQISCPVTATPSPVIFWVRENHVKDDLDYHDDPVFEDPAFSSLQQPLQHLPDILLAGYGGGPALGTPPRIDSEPLVDEAYNLHVTTYHEGLWACMAANEVGGLMLPVHVVGGGVARNSAGIGIVGVDEVEARAALLTPALELGHPSSAAPSAVTLKWRYLHHRIQEIAEEAVQEEKPLVCSQWFSTFVDNCDSRTAGAIASASEFEGELLSGRHAPILGVFVLGCERGAGFVSPRVQQLLQSHDISRHSRTHGLRQPGPESEAVRDALVQPEVAQHLHDGGDDRRDGTLAAEGGCSADRIGDSPFANATTKEEPDPQCSNLRVLGHASAQVTSMVLDGLQPYTSYWLFLVPHYKGVLGVPSNLQAYTSPQDVPSGWAVLSRWWAAQVGDGFYALTLHWRPVPQHLAHGVIQKYMVVVHERDTGVTHNVSVLGELTSLTLPNVTSSRVSVTLTAATVKGFGPSSPPARLDLLMAHYKEPGVGVGVVRSAWFLVLAGGAVAMLVVVVSCTVTARWCARGLQALPRDVSKNKVCSTGDPWGDVGGLWAVESDELHSDKSEKKLLTSNGSATADYAEVDAGSLRVNDDLSKSRLEPWTQGLLCPSPSPSRTSSVSQRNKHTQDYQYSAAETDTYEAVTAYDAASPVDDSETRPASREDVRQLRLNTESTTDLSMDCYNFSDEGEDDTQSCSDTEASFFIPRNHDRKREKMSVGETKENLSSCEDVQRIGGFPRSDCKENLSKTFRKPGEEGKERKGSDALLCSQVDMSASTSGASSMMESSGVGLPKVRQPSRSSVSQDSLEEQFERTLSFISQGGSWNVDSDYMSTSLYN